MGKRLETENTPERVGIFRVSKWVILFSYLFSGLNFVLFGFGILRDVPQGEEMGDKLPFLVIGFFFLALAVFALMDEKKLRQGVGLTVAHAAGHLLFAVLVLLMSANWWWCAVYGGEVLLTVAAVLFAPSSAKRAQ